MKKRSKLLLGLGAYFILTTLYGLTSGAYAAAVTLGDKAVWIVGTVVATAVGTGLLLHVRWAFWLYCLHLPIVMVPVLMKNPGANLNPGSHVMVITIIIVVFLAPVLLMWKRHQYLKSGMIGSANA